MTWIVIYNIIIIIINFSDEYRKFKKFFENYYLFLYVQQYRDDKNRTCRKLGKFSFLPSYYFSHLLKKKKKKNRLVIIIHFFFLFGLATLTKRRNYGLIIIIIIKYNIYKTRHGYII